MFTGIIETIGTIESIREEGTNKHFTLSSPITHELKIDQSVAHDGVCLTVVAIHHNQYTVTAIKETLDKTNLSGWKVGQKVNIERCMPAHGRFDGHIVQGHVDTTAICKHKADQQGSWEFTFELSSGDHEKLMVDKGSICINGISLTLVQATDSIFSVAIIPYTYEHTGMHQIEEGTVVNIEFDIVGKYIHKMLAGKNVSA